MRLPAQDRHEGKNDALTVATCPDCASRRGHCHGTLVLHATGDVECTDRDCADPVPARHELAAGCGEIAPPCGCVE